MKIPEKLLLYTIQPLEWYEKLLKEGIIYGDSQAEGYNMFEFDEPYTWMRNQMVQRVGAPKKEGAVPIWAWYHYDNAKKTKPDLRHTGLVEKGKKGIRVGFLKNREEVLLSDFELWHIPLNNGNIAGSEEEDNAFEEFAKKFEYVLWDMKTYPKELKTAVEKTWERIFDMDFDNEYATRPFEKKSIQATFWSLSLAEIVEVKEFVGR
ncbi:MAG: DUF3841 domain-containing protein [Flavobacteriales bacterium]|jgi:hypothetical protein|nr:DUF3841 domain-containing protein [Flavobacteriales bacterium]